MTTDSRSKIDRAIGSDDIEAKNEILRWCGPYIESLEKRTANVIKRDKDMAAERLKYIDLLIDWRERVEASQAVLVSIAGEPLPEEPDLNWALRHIRRLRKTAADAAGVPIPTILWR